MSTELPPIENPQLIAHRGYALRFPENSLEAIEAALKHGALYVEFDVHLSLDQVPVVIHDAKLQRTAGAEGEVFELTADQLAKLEVNEAGRLGEAFSGVKLPTLKQTVTLLESWPRAKIFVELKRASMKVHGVEAMVTKAMEILKPIAERCIIISFSSEAVTEARNQGAAAVGWVFEEWNDELRATAEALAPDYLFADQEKIPADAKLWPGPWQWAIYEVGDAETALKWGERGAAFVETMAIAELLDNPKLRPESKA